jgi:hypothetical protein
MVSSGLEEILLRETTGTLLRITRKADSGSGAYWLLADEGGNVLHSQLHPDDPLPFSDNAWGTVLLEDVLGDIADPHPLIREASRIGRSRLIIVQPVQEGRKASRLRQIASQYFLLFASENLSLDNEIEVCIFVIPLEDSAQTEEEFARRMGRL